MPEPILRDHQWRKKRAVPPFLAAGMNIGFSNWVRGTIPEVLWIAVLHEVLGVGPGVAAALALASAAQGQAGDASLLPPFCFARAFAALTPDQCLKVIAATEQVADATRAREALVPLLVLFPEYPLARVTNVGPDPLVNEASANFIGNVLGDLSDRRSKRAALVQGTAIYIASATGRLFFSEQVPPPNLEELLNYPDTEESKMAAAEVRAGINGLLGMADAPGIARPPEGWPASFWETALTIGDCR